MAIPGERVVFLVTIDDFYPEQGPIELVVEGDGLTVDQSTVTTPANGEMAEVTVEIDGGRVSGEATASVTFSVCVVTRQPNPASAGSVPPATAVSHTERRP